MLYKALGRRVMWLLALHVEECGSNLPLGFKALA